MTDLNGELIRLIEQNHREDGSVATAIPRLHLVRFSRPTERIHGFYEPAFCIVAQGRKRAMLGDRIFEYDRSRFLVVSVDVPVVGQIIDRSEEHTSELQSLMRISYAVFCLKKKNNTNKKKTNPVQNSTTIARCDSLLRTLTITI